MKTRTRAAREQGWMSRVRLAGHLADVCEYCGAADSLHGPLLPHCDRCKVKGYCDRVSQKAYFKQHKNT